MMPALPVPTTGILWSAMPAMSQPDPSWLDFPFKAVQADCVRIFAVQLTQDGYGYRYLQLAEIEAYAGTQTRFSPAG